MEHITIFIFLMEIVNNFNAGYQEKHCIVRGKSSGSKAWQAESGSLTYYLPLSDLGQPI